MTAERVNPFGDLGDLSDFSPAPAKPKTSKPLEKEVIDEVAAANGFPSRQPVKAEPSPVAASIHSVSANEIMVAALAPRQQRRYTTGRNQQINVKAKAETIEKFYRIADAQGVPLGEVLERALDALEKATK